MITRAAVLPYFSRDELQIWNVTKINFFLTFILLIDRIFVSVWVGVFSIDVMVTFTRTSSCFYQSVKRLPIKSSDDPVYSFKWRRRVREIYTMQRTSHLYLPVLGKNILSTTNTRRDTVRAKDWMRSAFSTDLPWHVLASMRQDRFRYLSMTHYLQISRYVISPSYRRLKV